MCSRYSLTSASDVVRRYLATTNDEPFPPRDVIAPTEPVLIARLDPRGARRLELVRWGLIPGWVKDPRDFSLLINARAETLSHKPTYRAGLRYRRCLVPADGYLQWTGPKGARTPYVVRPVAPGPIAFAGLWDHWLGADGSEMESMLLVTVAASPDVAGLHDRMPAILAADRFGPWLDCRSCPADEALAFLEPSRAGALHVEAFRRSSGTGVGQVRQIEGIDDPGDDAGNDDGPLDAASG